MTAPDPGLTDLIAATLHGKAIGSTILDRQLWGAFPNTMTISDLAAHVALVVEQHTNGRIAENTGLRRELADEQQRQSDASAELRVLRAMVARVEKLAAEYARDDQEHLNTFGQHHPVAGIAHDHLRAALEGQS